MANLVNKHYITQNQTRSGGEPLTTQRLIWPAWDLNISPPALETNAFTT